MPYVLRGRSVSEVHRKACRNGLLLIEHRLVRRFHNPAVRRGEQRQRCDRKSGHDADTHRYDCEVSDVIAEAASARVLTVKS